jgi:deoxyribodipyrimidine photolyase
MTTPITIFWFRRDLRLEDNAGLFHALNASENVLPIFPANYFNLTCTHWRVRYAISG